MSGPADSSTAPTSTAETQACCLTCLILCPDGGMPREERLHGVFESSSEQLSKRVRYDSKQAIKKNKGLPLKSIQQRKTKSQIRFWQRTAQDEALTCKGTSLPNMSSLALKHCPPNPASHASFPSFLWESLTQLGCRLFERPKPSPAEPSAQQRAATAGREGAGAAGRAGPGEARRGEAHRPGRCPLC